MTIFERLGDFIGTAAPYVAPLIPGAGPLVAGLSGAELQRRAAQNRSQFATGSQGQEAVSSTGSQGGLESAYSGVQGYTTPYQSSFRPGMPSISPTTAVSTALGAAMDFFPDIDIQVPNFFGGQVAVCGPKQQRLFSVRQNTDGSTCLSVTRKQQHQLKQMVMYMGIEGTASNLNLSVAELASLLVKRFPPRRRGISGKQLSTAKRVNRQIMGMAKQLQDACKTTAKRRR